jgi:hypothetical protein
LSTNFSQRCKGNSKEKEQSFTMEGAGATGKPFAIK